MLSHLSSRGAITIKVKKVPPGRDPLSAKRTKPFLIFPVFKKLPEFSVVTCFWTKWNQFQEAAGFSGLVVSFPDIRTCWGRGIGSDFLACRRWPLDHWHGLWHLRCAVLLSPPEPRWHLCWQLLLCVCPQPQRPAPRSAENCEAEAGGAVPGQAVQADCAQWWVGRREEVGAIWLSWGASAQWIWTHLPVRCISSACKRNKGALGDALSPSFGLSWADPLLTLWGWCRSGQTFFQNLGTFNEGKPQGTCSSFFLLPLAQSLVTWLQCPKNRFWLN